MAKVCLIEREKKRSKLASRYADKRQKLKAILKDPNASEEDKFDAQVKLQKLPKNSSPVRLQRRCGLTGRANGVYRKFGLSRNKLREHAMKGNIPGLKKSSW
jgi:small subunit ribosomal protein S14